MTLANLIEGFTGNVYTSHTEKSFRRPRQKSTTPRSKERVRRGESHSRVTTPDATVARAKVLYPRLGSYKKVGKAIGVSQWTVRDWILGRTRA